MMVDWKEDGKYMLGLNKSSSNSPILKEIQKENKDKPEVDCLLNSPKNKNKREEIHRLFEP